MKKYQLWLQRKSYSQHLINLIKIKTAVNTSQTFERKHRKMFTNPNPSPLKSRENSEAVESKVRDPRLGDVSYSIFNRYLKSKNLQLLRSFQIQKENQSMARRMKQVKSVINFPKATSSFSYDFSRRKNTEKKYELSNEQLRESKFRKYIKWQSNTISGLHKYYLMIEVLNVGKLIRIHDDFAGLWCELETEKGAVRSDLNQLNEKGVYKFCFPLQHDLGDIFWLKLYTCRGIQSQRMGQFELGRPAVGESEQGWHKSIDCRFEIELKIKYTKVVRHKAGIVFK